MFPMCDEYNPTTAGKVMLTGDPSIKYSRANPLLTTQGNQKGYSPTMVDVSRRSKTDNEKAANYRG